MHTFCLLFLVTSFFSSPVFAQDQKKDSINKKSLVISAIAEKGFVMIHSKAVEYLRPTYPSQFSFNIGTQQFDTTNFNLYGATIQKGVAFSYVNYNNAIIGKAYSVGYYFQPMYKLSKKTLFALKTEAGFVHQTNPYGANNNFLNKSYSSRFSTHLSLSAGIGWAIGEKLLLTTSANFHHTSNAAFKHPNLGINWVSSSIGLSYLPNGQVQPTFKRVKSKKWREDKIGKEVYIFYSPGQSYYFTNEFKRNDIMGLNVEFSKKVSNINLITAGSELYFNDITPLTTTKFQNNQAGLQSSFLIGHRLLMNRFFFSQQLGIYLSPYPSYNTLVSFRLGLNYQVNQHFLVGTNFKAHKQTADFLDFRLGYRW